ncbi:MAG: hypothetical protein HS122_19675 [Opitutaceae bacterium]|nr:hypothetical protein [Opitutaceae bacterium]
MSLPFAGTGSSGRQHHALARARQRHDGQRVFDHVQALAAAASQGAGGEIEEHPVQTGAQRLLGYARGHLPQAPAIETERAHDRQPRRAVKIEDLARLLGQRLARILRDQLQPVGRHLALAPVLDGQGRRGQQRRLHFLDRDEHGTRERGLRAVDPHDGLAARGCGACAVEIDRRPVRAEGGPVLFGQGK